MKLIKPNDKEVKKIIREIDDDIMHKIVQMCIDIDINSKDEDIYFKLYDTKYEVEDLSKEEQDLSDYLEEISEKDRFLLGTSTQANIFKHVSINRENFERIIYRYYISPNPKKECELIKHLTDEFVKKETPVKFKYLFPSKSKRADRIIIYSDLDNQKSIEQTLTKINKEYPSLFEGAERPLTWFYESNIPNVYIAPETPGTSFGIEFAKILLQAKGIYCYLNNITDSNYKLNIEEVYDDMKIVLYTLMLRKALILTKKNERVIYYDKFHTIYDYKTGVLTRSDFINHEKVEKTYQQNDESKNEFLKDFYVIYQMQPNYDVGIKHFL